MIITDIKRQEKNKNRLSIFIDNEFSFGMEDQDLVLSGIKIGQHITEDRLSELKKTCDYSYAKKLAFRALERKSCSSYDIRKKLSDFDEEIIDMVLNRLTELGYIDDEEYLKRYVSDAQRIKKRGEHRIVFDLCKMGFSSDDAHRAVLEYGEDQSDELLKMIEKKYGEGPFDYKEKQKILRYFIGRGFSFDEINSLLRD